MGNYLPYRGKFRRGKVTKFFASDENFPRRKISPTNNFTRRITDFKNVENYGMSRMQYFVQKQE